MSEITNENPENKAELQNQELATEKDQIQQIEQPVVNLDEDFEKVLRKKDQLLDEKKKVQSENAKLSQELNELKKALKRQEEEKLEEKQEYKKLWESTQEELKLERERRLEQEQKIVKSQKRKAVDRELGKPLAKERYYDFVPFDDIIIDADGSVNPDSVRYAVDNLRKNYPEVMPVTKVVKTGAEAPSNDGIIKTQKNLSEMKASERSNLKRKLLAGN